MNSLDQKYDEHLDDLFSTRLDEMYAARVELANDGVTNFRAVTPAAKEKLKGILKHYAKMPHPFTSCVRDNRKRFGNRAEQVCAVVKDLIRGTTKWRGKNNPNDKGTAGLKMSDSDLVLDVLLDDDTAHLIGCLSELDLTELLQLADLGDDDEGVKLAYPMQPDLPPAMTDKDHKFLDSIKEHHGKKLKLATDYLTGDPHPHAASVASDTVREATRHIERVNNLKKTGSPYGGSY